MASTDFYVTVKHVDSSRVKCAISGCKQEGQTKNRIEALVTLVEDEYQPHRFQMIFYLCDECFDSAKKAGYVGIPNFPQHICQCQGCKLARSNGWEIK